MQASIQSCSFVRRRAFVPRFVRIRPHFSGAARSCWPSSRSLTRYFQTAVGDRTRRTFGNVLKKRTERLYGSQSEHAPGKLSSNPQQLTNSIPALLKPSNLELAK